MKKSNPLQKQKERLLKRWSEEDYPGGTPRFQLALLAKDIVIFCLIPICAIFFYKVVETSISAPSKPSDRRRTDVKLDRIEKHSQIINFQGNGNGSTSGGGAGSDLGRFAKRAPGTIVRVRLLNVVETFSNAPVHVQVMDNGLGKEFIGATILGDAVSENGTGRVSMNFRFVRHPRSAGVAVPIAARALSLDGTYGLTGTKKEGLFARAAIRSAANNPNTVDASADKGDFKTLIARAVAAGLMQEMQSEASIAHTNAQVLTIKPMTEFFVELTDYFPGQR